ncbi:gibberellin 2-beta-dioxygenase-like [Prosopis cineraria]|uniref:gibberellin 2-beta-dioxygenase-like n=1 Tax=Prosopis cineraria TaxID=364024 RepID=UPI0024108617|nr:gibberellin 2-beta-dioxygenase-like [Prosopis cineraria]
MVVLSYSSLNQFLLPDSCMSTNTPSFINEIPEIDLSDPQAKTLIVKASQDLGFFKLVNHGVPFDLISNLETGALNFFALPQHQKDRAGPPDPFGYGNKGIGRSGDVGWLEYLLFNLNPEVVSPKSLSIFRENPETFRRTVEEYISAVKELSCEVLEVMAEGLGIEQRNVFSKLPRDERSDCYFRLNYYPPCEGVEGMKIEEKLVGFGEHTDPQIISVLRSNTSGLQICVKDGTWVSVPPDSTSFFVNVGDLLQTMTNGRFRSVRHRVVVPDTSKTRLSMIYFVGPPLNQKITPLPCLLSHQEESLYKEFTWLEYKNSTFNSKLSHDRLAHFHKS